MHHIGAHIAFAVAPGTFRPGCQMHGKITVDAVQSHNIYNLLLPSNVVYYGHDVKKHNVKTSMLWSAAPQMTGLPAIPTV